MQIQLSKNTITITDTLKRKAMRLYSEAIYKGISFTNKGGDMIADTVDPTAFDTANEVLICACITHVNGKEMQVTQEWLDELDNDEYKLIQEAVEKLKNDHAQELEEGKKNNS